MATQIIVFGQGPTRPSRVRTGWTNAEFVRAAVRNIGTGNVPSRSRNTQIGAGARRGNSLATRKRTSQNTGPSDITDPTTEAATQASTQPTTQAGAGSLTQQALKSMEQEFENFFQRNVSQS